ncbi:TonB family protein [Neptunicella sp. SCSIO 80796]|uniref:AgmX/PglI C-terminal domain-containing protein n=1 Tax=Neptunicella plasticusilytica TaxID=3117012 RepID=UPI003A4DFFA4
MSVATFNSVLPWSASTTENRRFSRITLVCLAITLSFAALVKWQEVPPLPREEKEKLPPQLTRFLQQKTIPPKVIEPPKPEPEPEIEKPSEKPPAKPVEKPKVIAPKKPQPVKVKPVASEAELAEQARKKASQSGLLAFKDQLANMRDSSQVQNNAATDLVKGAGQTSQTQRKFIGQKTNTRSQGIQTGNLSSDIGAKGELAGRKTTEFAAPQAGLPSIAQQELVEQMTETGGRSVESIRQVLDANKSAVYAIYRKALRRDASLQGKVTVKLIIDADGSVSDCKIVSSELNNPALEARLLSRIKAINFGVDQVSQTELDYTFNFLPF